MWYIFVGVYELAVSIKKKNHAMQKKHFNVTWSIWLHVKEKIFITSYPATCHN